MTAIGTHCELSRRRTAASGARFDVVGFGNAIVDIIATASPAFLEEQHLRKGRMQLVDEATASRLYDAMGPAVEISGGSVANSIAGLASLGARCAFFGKVHDDWLGGVFRHDIRALDVHFPTSPLADGPPTARCLVFVTPDAQRTMATCLGAPVELAPGDIDEAAIRGAEITYLEGYLFDRPHAKAAFRRAAAVAHAAGRRVALSLSDPLCVERHLDDFLGLVTRDVDILFASDSEIEALLGTSDADEIHARLMSHVEIAVITRGERGSLLVTVDAIHAIPPLVLGAVLDTTGAGDLYASGFLLGVARGMDLRRCGALASLCAAEAMGHFGARPQCSLRALAATHGFTLPQHA